MGGGGAVARGSGQMVINIYLVSYWKENLQFVCHPHIQVVGPDGCKTSEQRDRGGQGGQPVRVPENRNLTVSYMKATCHPLA